MWAELKKRLLLKQLFYLLQSHFTVLAFTCLTLGFTDVANLWDCHQNAKVILCTVTPSLLGIHSWFFFGYSWMEYIFWDKNRQPCHGFVNESWQTEGCSLVWCSMGWNGTFTAQVVLNRTIKKHLLSVRKCYDATSRDLPHRPWTRGLYPSSHHENIHASNT